MTVRYAELKDVDRLCELDRTNTVDRVRFYEKAEFDDWICNVEDNIILVAENPEGLVVGFLYCKIMSPSWALLDSFSVLPETRRKGSGGELFQYLKLQLSGYGISHLSTLIDAKRLDTILAAEHAGFTKERPYVWMELTV